MMMWSLADGQNILNGPLYMIKVLYDMVPCRKSWYYLTQSISGGQYIMIWSLTGQDIMIQFLIDMYNVFYDMVPDRK